MKRLIRPIDILNPTQTIIEASRFLWVNRITIRRWIKAGKIQAIIIPNGYQVPTFEIMKIAGENNINLWNPAPEGSL